MPFLQRAPLRQSHKTWELDIEPKAAHSHSFSKMTSAVINKKELNLFIDARGGTGKTYVMNTILAAVRLLDQESGGSIALAVGTTGIAANIVLQ